MTGIDFNHFSSKQYLLKTVWNFETKLQNFERRFYLWLNRMKLYPSVMLNLESPHIFMVKTQVQNGKNLLFEHRFMCSVNIDHSIGQGIATWNHPLENLFCAYKSAFYETVSHTTTMYWKGDLSIFNKALSI